ncbi:MAG: hypothetical protein JWM99_2134 [Verrucomicrobiales bacterium]|nr:hypothetical protein [Verrucomicrobiales bacterium]
MCLLFWEFFAGSKNSRPAPEQHLTDGSGSITLYKPKISSKSSRVSAQPAWAIPYSKEFWNQSGSMVFTSRLAGVARKTGDIDLNSVVDRVEHAFEIGTDGPTVKGKTYEASLDSQGVKFSAASPTNERNSAPPISIAISSVTIGTARLEIRKERDWSVMGNTAQALLSPDMRFVEHVQARGSGLQLAWIVSRPLETQGDLKMDLNIEGLTGAGASPDGLHFADSSGIPRMRVGRVSIVDSRGNAWPASTELSSLGVTISVAAQILAEATYPLAIDPEISAEFGIDQTNFKGTSGEMPAIANNGNEYLVVWSAFDSDGGSTIRGTRMTPDGIILDAEGLLIAKSFGSSLNYMPAVAASGDDFMTVWYQSKSGGIASIMGNRVNSQGGVFTSAAKKISNVSRIPFGLELTSNGAGYYLVWTDNNTMGASIDVEGNPGTAINFHSESFAPPAIAPSGSNYVVIYPDHTLLRFMCISGSGQVLSGSPFNTNQYIYNGRVGIASIDMENFVTWISKSNVYGALIAADGSFIKAPFIIADSSAAHRDVVAATDGSSYAVLFGNGPGTVYAARVRRDGTVVDLNGFLVASRTSGYRDFQIAAMKGSYLSVWDTSDYNLRARTFTAESLSSLNGDFLVSIAKPAGAQPVVAAGPNEFLVVWNTLAASGSWDIVGSRLSTSGEILDPTRLQIATTSADEISPAVASNGSDFMVGWVQLTDKQLHFGRVNAGGQVFDPGGVQGTTAPMRSTAASTLSIASLQGDYVAVWEDSYGNQSNQYSAPMAWSLPITAGGVAGAPRPLADANFSSSHPTIVAGNSSYLAVWQDWRNAGNLGPSGYLMGSDLYGARLNLGGEKMDASNILISSEEGNQSKPSAAFNGQNFLIAWEDERSADRWPDIYGAILPEGNAGREETRPLVIRDGFRPQTAPVLSSNGDGFLLNWIDGWGNDPANLAAGMLLNGSGLSASEVFQLGSSSAQSLSAAFDGTKNYAVLNDHLQQNGSSVLGRTVAAFSPPLAGLDRLTGGDWKSAYGSDGNYIAGLNPIMPAYATVQFTGPANWIWQSSTTARPALQKENASDRIAACFYSATDFSVRLQFTDSPAHMVAFYVLDWDNAGRSQTVEIVDNATGAVLSSRRVSGFANGEYLVYSLQGDVQVRFSRMTGPNAVLSGIFFGGAWIPPASVATPEILPNGGSFASPVEVSIHTATARSTLQYTLDGSTPGPEAQVYTGPFILNQNATLTAVARSAGRLDSPPSSATFTFQNRPGVASATYVGNDTVSGGNWIGPYGAEGRWIVQDSENLPSYISVIESNGAEWVWDDNPVNVEALQRGSDPNKRIAACIYGETFTLALNFTDAAPHRVTWYSLDWDTSERSQIVYIIDTATGNQLATHASMDFSGGEYVTWDIAGSVTLRLVRQAGYNAVLSGLFFDPVPGTATVATPVITPNGGDFDSPVQVTLNSATSGSQLFYTTDGSIPTRDSTPYSGAFTLTESASLRVRAFKPGLSDSPNAQAKFTINSRPGTDVGAAFIGEDRTAQGSWPGLYGSTGFIVIGDWISLPGDLTVSVQGKSDHTWAYDVSESRALQKYSSLTRLAACWYAAVSFEVDLNFTDVSDHKMAFYFLDWDQAGRQEQVEIFDSGTGGLLDRRSVTVFADGTFLKWNIHGRVLVRITRIAGPNATLSGIFIDDR